MATQTASVAPSIIRPTAPVLDVQAYVAGLTERLGNVLYGIELFFGQVLVAKFIRDKQGSIHMSDRTQKEDRYQGKVGYVLKTGPCAFQDTDELKFYGASVKEGDWIWYRASDGFDVNLTPVGTTTHIECRLFEQESLIRGRLARPDLIY